MGRSPFMAGLQRAVCIVLACAAHLGFAQIWFEQVPSHLTVVDDAPVVLRCAATAPGIVRYVWEKDGVPYARTQWINITSASLDDSGWYVCIAIQGSRAIRSQPAQVRVTARSTAVSGGAINGTSSGGVLAVAVAVPLSLLGLLLLAYIVVCAAVVCFRRRSSGEPNNANARTLEDQTSEEMSLLEPNSRKMSVGGTKEDQTTAGGDTPDRDEVTAGDHVGGDGAGAKGGGVNGASDGAKGASDGATGDGANGAGDSGHQKPTDIRDDDPDDLQLDVTMFDQPLHPGALKTFSAENLAMLNEVPAALQRSPKVTNLSHLRPPRTSNGDLFQDSNLPRSKDAMKRVFHSLISIPAASSEEAGGNTRSSFSGVPPVGLSEHLELPQNEDKVTSSVDTAQGSTGGATPLSVDATPLSVDATPPSADATPPGAHVADVRPCSTGAVLATSLVEESWTCLPEGSPGVPWNVQQPQLRVSDLRQMFLPGAGVKIPPPHVTTVGFQRLQRSKLITQRSQQLLGHQSNSLHSPDAPVHPLLGAVPDVVATEMPNAHEQKGGVQLGQSADPLNHQSADPLNHQSADPLNQQPVPESVHQASSDDSDLGASDRDLGASHQTAGDMEQISGGSGPVGGSSPVGSGSGPVGGGSGPVGGSGLNDSKGNTDHSEGGGRVHQTPPSRGVHNEPPSRGHDEPSREFGEPTHQRTHAASSPVFVSPVSKSPVSKSHQHRPTSNLLVSMSAGSPGSGGFTPPPSSGGFTPPSSRRTCEGASPSLPRSRAGVQLTAPDVPAGYRMNETSPGVTRRGTPSSPVISSPTPVIPYRTDRAGDGLSDEDGDDVSSNRGDEETSSISSDDELIAPLSMAPPPAKHVDATGGSSHHHPHPHAPVLSPSVKDCVSQMSRVVHTHTLFSEPRKAHSRRQHRKLSAIPEDSPTLAS